MKKHKNRIEIVGAYYLRIIVSNTIFESEQFYETKSGALRAAHRINDKIAYGLLSIYDYDGVNPGIGNKNAKYTILQ